MSKKKVDLNILTFFCPNKQRHTLVYCRGNITLEPCVLQQEVSGHSAADSSRHSAMSDEEYYEEEEGEEEYEEEEYEEEEEEEEEKTIPDE